MCDWLVMYRMDCRDIERSRKWHTDFTNSANIASFLGLRLRPFCLFARLSFQRILPIDQCTAYEAIQSILAKDLVTASCLAAVIQELANFYSSEAAAGRKQKSKSSSRRARANRHGNDTEALRFHALQFAWKCSCLASENS